MNWHSPELAMKLEARCGVEDLRCSNSKLRCRSSDVFNRENCIEAMRSAFRSAESEALHSAEHYGPLKTRLYHRAKHYGPLKARLKTTAKSQIFVPFFYI